MAKPEALELAMLLSALESWGMSNGQRLPDYLLERLDPVRGKPRHSGRGRIARLA